ncbi:hypothetical protein LPJGGPFB_04818 [Ensifer adhaerens]|uniref:hypothetical protein n=1 Tax=Ensifer adhaerens TaxID=106592 RepID=UPI00156A47FC|nr:hypothetical protein [Ensifer adhaerens]NRP21559.1 hypothetical protein [Ensifer adhaerens]
MYKIHEQPESDPATGLPIAVMLLSVAAIAIYLVVGAEILSDKGGQGTVYLPKLEAESSS